MTSGNRPVHIRVTLETETADSVRHITMPGWTGAVVMCSRAQYQGIRDREDFGRPGVYVLVGPGDRHDPRQQIYIGQTNAAGTRLDHHLSRKDFWTDLILFTTSDDSLNSAHCRHIEQRLYDLAAEVGRARLLNGNKPGGARLHPADRATANDFLDRMLLIYPLLGVSAFVGPSEPPPPPPPAGHWVLRRAGCDGRAIRTANGFVLLAGSVGRSATMPGLPVPSRVRRQHLIDDGTLRITGDRAEVTRDCDCGSPSWAGVVLTGGAINGRTAWKNAEGLTIEQVETASSRQEITD